MYPNVKYELKKLESLLDIDEWSDGNHIDVKDDTSLWNRVGTEIQNLKRIFTEQVFAFTNEEHLRRYLQYHYQALIRIMDDAFSKRQSHLTYNREQTNKSPLSHLTALLRFMQANYSRYLEEDTKLPDAEAFLSRLEIEHSLTDLRECFSGVEVDDRVIKAILSPVEIFLNSQPGGRVYDYQVSYLKILCEQVLLSKEQIRIAQNPNEIIFKIAIRLNANTLECYLLLSDFVTTEIGTIDTRAGKLERLCFFLKLVSQIPVQLNLACERNAPDLKQQLSSFLNEDIIYFEKLSHIAGNRSQGLLNSEANGFKLKFEISVAQLAFLFKVFLETNFIRNQNIAELLKFLAGVAVTKRSENISYESFRTKYYNSERGTRESVRMVLQNMVYYIDKTR